MQNFNYIFNSLLEAYVKEFGERKMNSVIENVAKSKKIAKLVTQSNETGLPIDSKIILNYLNTIPFFIFSRGQTQAVAALIILKYWNDEVNFGFIILTENQVLLVALDILKECQITYF